VESGLLDQGKVLAGDAEEAICRALELEIRVGPAAFAAGNWPLELSARGPLMPCISARLSVAYGCFNASSYDLRLTPGSLAGKGAPVDWVIAASGHAALPRPTVTRLALSSNRHAGQWRCPCEMTVTFDRTYAPPLALLIFGAATALRCRHSCSTMDNCMGQFQPQGCWQGWADDRALANKGPRAGPRDVVRRCHK